MYIFYSAGIEKQSKKCLLPSKFFVMLTERTHQCLLELLKCAIKMGFLVKFLSHTRYVDQENVGLMCDVMRHKFRSTGKRDFIWPG